MNRSPESPAACTPASTDDARAERRFDEAALSTLALNIKTWGRELGFAGIGISDTDLSAAEAPLAAWLEAGCHGEMDYIGYGLWSRLLSRYPASQVAPFSLLVPIVGLASASLFLDEQLSAAQIVGALLVMAGLAVNVFGGWVMQRLAPAR